MQRETSKNAKKNCSKKKSSQTEKYCVPIDAWKKKSFIYFLSFSFCIIFLQIYRSFSNDQCNAMYYFFALFYFVLLSFQKITPKYTGQIIQMPAMKTIFSEQHNKMLNGRIHNFVLSFKRGTHHSGNTIKLNTLSNISEHNLSDQKILLKKLLLIEKYDTIKSQSFSNKRKQLKLKTENSLRTLKNKLQLSQYKNDAT